MYPKFSPSLALVLLVALATASAVKCQGLGKQADNITNDLIDTAFILGKNAAKIAKTTRDNIAPKVELEPIAPTINSLREHLESTVKDVAKKDKRIADGIKAVDPYLDVGTKALGSLTKFGRKKFNELAKQHEQRMKERKQR